MRRASCRRESPERGWRGDGRTSLSTRAPLRTLRPRGVAASAAREPAISHAFRPPTGHSIERGRAKRESATSGSLEFLGQLPGQREAKGVLPGLIIGVGEEGMDERFPEPALEGADLQGRRCGVGDVGFDPGGLGRDGDFERVDPRAHGDPQVVGTMRVLNRVGAHFGYGDLDIRHRLLAQFEMASGRCEKQASRPHVLRLRWDLQLQQVVFGHDVIVPPPSGARLTASSTEGKVWRTWSRFVSLSIRRTWSPGWTNTSVPSLFLASRSPLIITATPAESRKSTCSRSTMILLSPRWIRSRI